MGEEVRPADRESFTTRASAVRGYAWYSIAAARGRAIGKKGKELVATLMTPVVTGMPTHHYNDTTLCNGMLIAGIQRGHNVDQLAHRMLEAHWRDDADLADLETLTRLANEVDLDPIPLLDAALSPEATAVYLANTEEAIDRSVFGSPTYFVDGDMFYGQDHLEFVERALKQPFAGIWPRERH
jgi:2-hydroxychromene-2-carboxylate isomerase